MSVTESKPKAARKATAKSAALQAAAALKAEPVQYIPLPNKLRYQPVAGV